MTETSEAVQPESAEEPIRNSWPDLQERATSAIAKQFQALGIVEEKTFLLADRAITEIEANVLSTIKGASFATSKDPDTGALTLRWSLGGELKLSP